MSLWGGRFTEDLDPFFKQFNDSLPFDYQLAEQDIVGSKAWATAIHHAKVISEQELVQLHNALDELLAQVQQDPQSLANDGDEDIHSWVERNLIEKVGQLGKKTSHWSKSK
jgi:argininosuccinate lyase/amino-acid N-acetyltransferase